MHGSGRRIGTGWTLGAGVACIQATMTPAVEAQGFPGEPDEADLDAALAAHHDDRV